MNNNEGGWRQVTALIKVARIRSLTVVRSGQKFRGSERVITEILGKEHSRR